MSSLCNFLELTYTELEALNRQAREEQNNTIDHGVVRERRLRYLHDTKGIRAVTVCFTDLEGRLHSLDYDKSFLCGSEDNLTFDGSSIRGFSAQHESDLRLAIDWRSFYWLPADIFGAGKVLVFATVRTRDGKPFSADMRGQLQQYSESILKKDGYRLYAANEIEGFLFQGKDAEKRYAQTQVFEFASSGGYYHALPTDPMRQFIDIVSDVLRALGITNEKNHPEVAPSQFEINYSYMEMLQSADTVQLYKLICRQVANAMGLTASFLPKPVTRINGSGMHTNISVGKENKNLFYDKQGKEGLSPLAWSFINNILAYAQDICLMLNPSVNAYRRLDPHFEAPNQIKVSAIDRGSMIRIPVGNERSARIEVRSVGPDANPYMLVYALAKTGLEGKAGMVEQKEKQFLPDNVYDAIALCKKSDWVEELLSKDVLAKFVDLKRAQADRCPKALGAIIKPSEIQYHHEVTNQALWSAF